jgi:hypothetical protein
MVFSITLDGESLFDCIGENNPTGGMADHRRFADP